MGDAMAINIRWALLSFHGLFGFIRVSKKNTGNDDATTTTTFGILLSLARVLS